MSNIYNIQQELLSIFEEIEENYGELTPEIEEKLAITQESFKNKIKSYIGVINSLNDDLFAIKNEKARLNDLQKSKEKTIERLKKIIVEAVNNFGDESKSGTKFVDYITGKVSIKTTKAIEVDEDAINAFINKYTCGLSYYDMLNQLDRSILYEDTLLDYANNDDGTSEFIPNLTLDDLANVDANIEINVSIKDLLNTDKGFELAKSLIKYNDFKISAKADKNAIKQEMKNTNKLPPYAELVENKSLIIK